MNGPRSRHSEVKSGRRALRAYATTVASDRNTPPAKLGARLNLSLRCARRSWEPLRRFTCTCLYESNKNKENTQTRNGTMFPPERVTRIFEELREAAVIPPATGLSRSVPPLSSVSILPRERSNVAVPRAPRRVPPPSGSTVDDLRASSS